MLKLKMDMSVETCESAGEVEVSVWKNNKDQMISPSLQKSAPTFTILTLVFVEAVVAVVVGRGVVRLWGG